MPKYILINTENNTFVSGLHCCVDELKECALNITKEYSLDPDKVAVINCTEDPERWVSEI